MTWLLNGSILVYAALSILVMITGSVILMEAVTNTTQDHMPMRVLTTVIALVTLATGVVSLGLSAWMWAQLPTL